MDNIIFSGIQQMGIGVSDVHQAWKWYREMFQMDIPVFEEAAEAGLMLPYTGGVPRSRHAILALNRQGGGGMEIWQYTSRVPEKPKFEVQLGDLGIYITKIKCKNINDAFNHLKNVDADIISDITTSASSIPHFFVKDPAGNIFEVIESNSWFRKIKGVPFGGIYGAIIGVTDIEKSQKFYQEILGYDKVLFKGKSVFTDLKGLSNADKTIDRVVLTNSIKRKGPFGEMIGDGQIELIKVHDFQPRNIFKDRLWGDLGYIHLCHDVVGMKSLQKKCESAGHPFTVDSQNSFDMGEAAGHFTYIEDPDGALLEFVETHKVPIMKKWNWYIDLTKRDPEKHLPRWMIKAMGLNRKKD